MLDVNVIALCLCTKEAVASMRERGVDDGQIIHIGRYLKLIRCSMTKKLLAGFSMSGYRIPVGPGNKFYCATKFAVRALLEGHRQELRELKIHIRVSVFYAPLNACLNISRQRLFLFQTGYKSRIC